MRRRIISMLSTFDLFEMRNVHINIIYGRVKKDGLIDYFHFVRRITNILASLISIKLN